MTRRNPLDERWSLNTVRWLETGPYSHVPAVRRLADDLRDFEGPRTATEYRLIKGKIERVFNALEARGKLEPEDEAAAITKALLEGSLGLVESGIARPMPGTRQGPLRDIEERHPQAGRRQREREAQAARVQLANLRELADVAVRAETLLVRMRTEGALAASARGHELVWGEPEQDLANEPERWWQDGVCRNCAAMIHLDTMPATVGVREPEIHGSAFDTDCPVIQRYPREAIQRINQLRAQTAVVAGNRGHVITWFDIVVADRGVRQTGMCQRCQREIQLQSDPAPNDTDTSGEALAVNCGARLTRATSEAQGEDPLVKEWNLGYDLDGGGYSFERVLGTPLGAAVELLLHEEGEPLEGARRTVENMLMWDSPDLDYIIGSDVMPRGRHGRTQADLLLIDPMARAHPSHWPDKIPEPDAEGNLGNLMFEKRDEGELYETDHQCLWCEGAGRIGGAITGNLCARCDGDGHVNSPGGAWAIYERVEIEAGLSAPWLGPALPPDEARRISRLMEPQEEPRSSRAAELAGAAEYDVGPGRICEVDVDEATYIGDGDAGVYFQVCDRSIHGIAAWYMSAIWDANNTVDLLVVDEGPFQTEERARQAGEMAAKDWCIENGVNYEDEEEDGDPDELLHIDLTNEELDVLQGWYSGQGDPLYALQSSGTLERGRISSATSNLSRILHEGRAGDGDMATIEGLIQKLEALDT